MPEFFNAFPTLMAQQKLVQLDERLQAIQMMKGILVQALDCQCNTLADYGATLPAEHLTKKL